MQLAHVLARKGIQRHELGVAHELGHIGARAGERVQNVHALVGKPAAELPLQGAVGGVKHVVHYLDRRVDDAQLLARAGEGLGEELVVEVFDEGLAVGVGAAEGRAAAHAAVELVQAALVVGGEVADAVAPEGVEKARDGHGDGVGLGKGVVAEERVKDGQRHHVLGHHLHGRLLGDAGVERVAQGA